MKAIVVPLDGSEVATLALRSAATFAEASGGKLRLVASAMAVGSLAIGSEVDNAIQASDAYLVGERSRVWEGHGLDVDLRVDVADLAHLNRL